VTAFLITCRCMIASSDQALCVQVASVLKARWPEGSVHLFGSTANCLSITNNNDIDVCLELPELPDEQARCPGPSACEHSRPQLHTQLISKRAIACKTCLPLGCTACEVQQHFNCRRAAVGITQQQVLQRAALTVMADPIGPVLRQAEKSEVVEEMARVLEGAGMRDVLPLAKARVPVVKCIAPETGTKVPALAFGALVASGLFC